MLRVVVRPQRYRLQGFDMCRDSDITDDRVDQLLSHEYTYERDERTHNAVYRAKIEEERAIEKEEVRHKAERQRILALNSGKRQRETAIKKPKKRNSIIFSQRFLLVFQSGIHML